MNTFLSYLSYCNSFIFLYTTPCPSILRFLLISLFLISSLHFPTEFESFYATHFSSDAVAIFGTQFLCQEKAETGDDGYDDYGNEEDNDLGYYPDGVKRTLTEEQIAIFRHSELETLRRAEAKRSNQGVPGATEPTVHPITTEAVDILLEDADLVEGSYGTDDAAEASEDGEIESEQPALTKAELKRRKRQRARQKKKEGQKFQPEKKPDLRKRTWDVVEAGMDSLVYDDLEMSKGGSSASAAQRKQISYDD
ncbi:hypothetical protein GGS20DRAFT_595374 [Poronia punctata]|nr:hypothetical protein GGS20DRAFT_595374 [Poronia punctata]